MKPKKEFLTVGLIIVFFSIIIANSLFFFVRKDDFFLDEKYSFYAANAKVLDIKEFANVVKESNYSANQIINKITASYPPEMNREISLEELDNLFSVSGENKFSYLSTLLVTLTDSHPPLYYLLLNTICSVLPFLSVKVNGFLLNLIFLLATCWIIYKIACMLSDKWCALGCMLFYGLSFDFINNVTYMRMYALLSFFVTLLLYFYLRWMENGFDRGRPELLAICVVEIVAMMTQFYAAIFIIPLFLLTVLLHILQAKRLKRYLWSQILAGVVYLLCWPLSIYQLIFDESGEDVRNNLNLSNLLERIRQFVSLLKTSIFANSGKIMAVICMIAIVYFLYLLVVGIKSRKAETGSYLYLLVPTGCYFVVAANISPWVVDRYMMAITPSICIILMLGLYNGARLLIKNKNIVFGIVMLVTAFVYLKSLKLTPNYLYTDSSTKADFINAYQDCGAIVVDPDNDSEFVDVWYSVNHPSWIFTKESMLDNCIASNSFQEKKCVVYINIFCDNEQVLSEFRSQGMILDECSYEKDFYKVFRIKN